MDLKQLVRRNIWNLKPYSSARDEFKGEASVFLDANENPLNPVYNRYPDPLQWKLKDKIAQIKNINSDSIFLGNGSDEAIDLIIRVFCEPGIDNVIAIDPTYGMYKVCSDINNVEYRPVLLEKNFQLNAGKLLHAVDDNSKVIFLCSPNNPSGNILDRKEVAKVITSFSGIVVLDEAYIDFSPGDGWLKELNENPNLIILQTFSKAWGLAAVRLGMAFASPDIIGFLNKVKYPYNINVLTQDFVFEQLGNMQQKEEWVDILLKQRESLIQQLRNLSVVKEIYPSDANFILIKVTDADRIYNGLVEKGVIVRNRNRISLCEEGLRITVGTELENETLIREISDL